MAMQEISNLMKIMEMMDESCVIVDEAMKILHVNQTFLTLSHYLPEFLLNKGITEFLQIENEEVFIKTIKSMNDEMVEGRTFEHLIFKKNSGNLYNITLKACKIHLSKTVGFLLLFKNVTALHEIQEMLHVELDRVGMAKQLAAFGEWEIDLVTNELLVSDEILEIYGIESKDFHGKVEDIGSVCFREDYDHVINAFKSAVYNFQDFEMEHRALKNGKVIYLKIKGKIYYHQMQPIRSVGIVQDITNTKERENTLKILIEENEKSKTAIIGAFGSLAEVRDNDTGKHIQRTQEYVKLLGTHLFYHTDYQAHLNDELLETLSQVAPLHDIGKVGISDNILLKPAKLDADEYREMQKHTVLGKKVIESARKSYELGDSFYLDIAEKVIISHHERWDGKGYPYGLAGHEIPIEGRIMALADVYDALRAKRIYKRSFTHEEAEHIIINERGKQFDPIIVDAFLTNTIQFKRISELYSDIN